VLKRQWQEMKGKLKEWWADLPDDDVNRIDGSHEKLIGALQQRYGYAKDRALREIERRIDEFSNRSQDRRPPG